MKEEGKEKGRKYFNLTTNNVGKRGPWFEKMGNLDRKSITTMNRIRSNHYNLAESLHRKGLIESPECECGEGIEDLNHVIWKCERYAETREEFRVRIEGKGIREGEEVVNRINEKELAIGKIIIGFLNKIKRDI